MVGVVGAIKRMFGMAVGKTFGWTFWGTLEMVHPIPMGRGIEGILDLMPAAREGRGAMEQIVWTWFRNSENPTTVRKFRSPVVFANFVRLKEAGMKTIPRDR